MFSLRNNHILQALVVLIVLWLAFLLKDVLILVFIAFLLVTALHPVVRWLENRRIPTPLAVLLPVIGVLVAFALIGFYIVPQLTSEVQRFIDKIPTYIAEIKNNGINLPIDAGSWREALKGHFGDISDVVISATTIAAEVIVGIISIVIISLYWLGSYDNVQQYLLSFVPAKSRSRAADVWARIEKKFVSWVVAQVLLGVVVGLFVWIGAIIIGLPFAGALGVIAGLLEIIPTFGPIAAAIPGILLGFSISWKTAVAALVLYVVIQQLENHILAPVLLGRTVSLSPIIVIVSLLAGATLYGVLGAILAVPVALVFSAFIDSYREVGPMLKPSSEVSGAHPTTRKS